MDVRLEIAVEIEGSTTVLHLHGEVDLASVGTLRACLDAVDPHLCDVVLDLAGVTFLDSTGLGELARTGSRLRSQGGRLDVRNAFGTVRRALEISGLDLELQPD